MLLQLLIVVPTILGTELSRRGSLRTEKRHHIAPWWSSRDWWQCNALLIPQNVQILIKDVQMSNQFKWKIWPMTCNIFYRPSLGLRIDWQSWKLPRVLKETTLYIYYFLVFNLGCYPKSTKKIFFQLKPDSDRVLSPDSEYMSQRGQFGR